MIFCPSAEPERAANHRYLAGGGDEYRKLEEMKATNPKLRAFAVIDSGDPFFVTARLRYAALPFATLPVADYEAAAEHFQEMDQTVAVNVLASSGWVAEARHELLSDEGPVAGAEPARRDDHPFIPTQTASRAPTALSRDQEPLVPFHGGAELPVITDRRERTGDQCPSEAAKGKTRAGCELLVPYSQETNIHEDG